MIIPEYRLVRHVPSGKFCVQYSTTEWSKPVLVRHYWPIVEGEEWLIDYRGQPLRDNGPGSGAFSFQRLGGNWYTVNLVDGPKTRPIETTREEIPPPTKRVPTRWNAGGWEKYLKRDGWVRCPLGNGGR